MKKVHVWTVDESEDILRMAKLGVDSIITNFPLIARQALEV
jgi:glycerophosphoryl diester phosphodiesterase